MNPHTEGMPFCPVSGRVWNPSISRWISRNDWDSGVTLSGTYDPVLPTVPGDTVFAWENYNNRPAG
jgi:hypothetical protein